MMYDVSIPGMVQNFPRETYTASRTEDEFYVNVLQSFWTAPLLTRPPDPHITFQAEQQNTSIRTKAHYEKIAVCCFFLPRVVFRIGLPKCRKQ